MSYFEIELKIMQIVIYCYIEYVIKIMKGLKPKLEAEPVRTQNRDEARLPIWRRKRTLKGS